MHGKNIDDRLNLRNLSDMFGGLAETPAGIIAPARSVETLIKSEARRLVAAQQQNQPFLFSKNAMFHNMLYHGARAKPMGTPSFPTLFAAARESFIDAILIRARVNQSKMVWQKAVSGKAVGFRIVHDQHDDPKFKPTPDVLRRCKEMEDFFSNPTPPQFAPYYPMGIAIHESGIKDFIVRLVEAELVIDRKVMFRSKQRDGKGYAYFHWVPGETIFPVHEALRQWEEKNAKKTGQPRRGVISPGLIEAASKATGFDLHNSAYVQIDRAGDICAAFTADEICIHMSNPSSEMDRYGFGVSPLELSLDVTRATLMAWNYNKELFNTNYPENILMVSGEYDKPGLEAFKNQLYGDVGKGANQRLPVISSGGEGSNNDANALKIEAIKLRDAPKDMLFDQLFRMLVAIKCAAYGAHPSIINFQVDSGGSGGSLFGHNPVDEIEFSKEHGFLPSLMDLTAWLTRCLIKPRYDDLKIIIEGLDDGNEKEKQEIFLNKVKTYRSKNEARMADGEEPDGFWLPKEKLDKLGPDDPDYQRHYENPMNYPADAPVATYLTALASKKSMEQQAEMAQDDPNSDGQDSPYQDDDNPWGTGAFSQPAPDEGMQKSRRERKYLKITIA